MGSSFKLIKWIGIAFVIMAVVAIGMAVMKGFDTFIVANSNKLEVMDNNELNNALSPYKGSIKGTKVRQLINFLAKNAKDEHLTYDKLPDIAYQLYLGEEFKIIESTVKKPNSSEISKIASLFDSTGTYTVEFMYTKSGIVNAVIIKADENEKFEFEPNET